MNYNTDNPKFHEEVFRAVGDIVHECYDYLSEEEAKNLKVIYGLGSAEEGWLTFKPFYYINDKLLTYGDIKDKDTMEAQIGIQQCGTEFLERLSDIFKSYDQTPPTQIKIQYYTKKEKVEYQFEYDLIWSNRENSLSDSLHEEYFEEIKTKIESN